MEMDLAGVFDHSSTDFQEAILNRIELSVGPGRALESLCFQRVEQHVCGTMEEETELVGFESVARCSVGVQEGFVVLDVAFHTGTCAVDAVVDKLSLTTF